MSTEDPQSNKLRPLSISTDDPQLNKQRPLSMSSGDSTQRSLPQILVEMLRRDQPIEIQLAVAKCLTNLCKANAIEPWDSCIVYLALPTLGIHLWRLQFFKGLSVVTDTCQSSVPVHFSWRDNFYFYLGNDKSEWHKTAFH